MSPGMTKKAKIKEQEQARRGTNNIKNDKENTIYI